MPLHLLGKKSWNVYNANNIAKVKRDEAAAAAREEAEEQRMQEIDAERRIAILRGVTPPPLPDALEPKREEKRRRDDGAGGVNKKRRVRGEDDTDRDIRLAKEEQEAGSATRGRLAEAIERKSNRTSDAPLVDRTGHVNLFPVDEHAIRKAQKNEEAEREKAKTKKELEDQYTMRFSNAAGFKQGLEKPWYAAQTKDFTRKNDAARGMLDEVSGKDVWGNEDPRRKEREMSRLVGNDPMAVMRQAQKQLKDVERERAKWKAERDEEMRQLDRRERRRSRRRPEDDQLDGFSLDSPAVDEREDRPWPITEDTVIEREVTEPQQAKHQVELFGAHGEQQKRGIAKQRKSSLRRTKNSTEELRKLRIKGSSRGTNAPGGDSGRLSQHFTVGNVGNNGVIYLRPVTRSGNERPQPSPPSEYPSTAPDPSGPGKSDLRPPSNAWRETSFSSPSSPRASQWHEFKSKPEEEVVHTYGNEPPKLQIHRRARSYSIIDGHDQSQGAAPGTLKIVIDRPSDQRPKTAEAKSQPVLDVSIPHYRLGRPHFSARGSSVFRSYTNTPVSTTEDLRSSAVSRRDLNALSNIRPMMTQRTVATQRQLAALPLSPRLDGLGKEQRRSSTATRTPLRAEEVEIEPAIYDTLTAAPNDPSAVRLAPGTGDISAATPARLIAHITSPNFLDYELLSDFFLTYRSYLTPTKLLSYLIARLQWSVNCSDDSGRIVRVRTFVALRHWILNYFADDFIPDHQLRSQFCERVNRLHHELRQRKEGGAGDAKVLNELKKCWRRTCVLYWDVSNTLHERSAVDDITPGGRPESIALLDGYLPYSQPDEQGDMGSAQSRLESESGGLKASSTDQGPAQSTVLYHLPRFVLPSARFSVDPEGAQIPALSEQSIQAKSCSIPVRTIHRSAPAQSTEGSHPIVAPQPMSPTTPSSKKQARPLHQHKRSSSFSDALRDTRTSRPTSHRSSKGVPLTLPYPLAGTLIRGVMIPPMAPFVDVFAPTSPTTGKGVPASRGSDTANASAKAPVASTPKVKTLFGTMRRALSSSHVASRSPVRSENSTSLSNGQSSDRSNAASAPRSIVQRQDSRQELARTEVRMDLLAVRVIASFHQTLKLDNPLGQESIVNDRRTKKPQQQQGAAVPDGGEKGQKVPEPTRLRNSVTAGGSSNDAAPFGSPKMSGDTAASGAKTSLLYEGRGILLGNSSRMRDHAGHNVSTSTERDLGSKRDSQYLHGIPPVSEVQGCDHEAETPIERVATVKRPAVRTRDISSRSMSSGSASLRRYASFQSGMVKHSKDRSLDTTSAASIQRHASDTHAFEYDQSPIRRQLRRRPGGGDLRAVENVHNLGPITRPRSTGSLSNLSHSVTNSAVYDFPDAAGHVDTSKAWRNSSLDISIGRRRRKSPSLMDTHSSQPNLRPSFEAEVAKLAKLPDDDEEGGIESALLKLEGRYEKRRSSLRSAPQTARVRTTVTPKDIHENVSRRNGGEPVLHAYTTPPQSRMQDISAMPRSNTSSDKPRALEATPPRQSEDSYSSIPLLERGLSDVGTKKREDAKKTWSRVYIPTRARKNSSATREPSNSENPQAVSSSPSMVYVEKTQGIERGAQARAATPQSLLHESFLLDDGQSLSDISTDLSTDVIDQSDSANNGLRSFFDDEPVDHESYASFAPSIMQHPAIPPSSGEQSTEPSPELNQRQFKLRAPVLPPLNQYSDVPHTTLPHSFGAGAIGSDAVELSEVKESPSPRSPVHIPFILAYESEVLAEQFTIVEKDALDEIDWRELMEVRWKQTSPSVRNWVEYLRDEDPHGVEVVIARFNTVVKWALSECVMTEDIDERVKCIVKYIHIAAHARRLRNYATMYQITIALLSSDCSRLTRTWALVPQTDKQMESATVEEGCIPFIGIYTHDLIYNAQKPASFPSPVPGGEPLTNFERHHTSATIVKNLLRLLEASSKYNFRPDRTILSRCLWMATLDDEEISARSRKLE